MNLAHVHLLLNHFPIIGGLIAFGLLLLGMAGKSDDLKRASLAVWLGIALLTIATYVSGNGAEEAVCKAANAEDPCLERDVSKALIQAHESAALSGFALMELTGAFAWLGLWQFRRIRSIPGWNQTAVALLSLATLLLMARASNAGGEIRHPEIRSAPQTATASLETASEVPFAREVGLFVMKHTWIWPTCETLHFIGLSLLFGITAVVDLRVLGMMKGAPFAELHRLLPWGVMGFGVNLVTGMLFFIADPGQYTHNVPFQWKIVLMLLAALNLLYFTVFETPWLLEPGDDAPAIAKLVAASALFLVVGVMFCGRMLPFLGDSF
jgi:uncharacterized membrane protein